MRQFRSYNISDISLFKKKALLWSNRYEKVCFLDNNNYSSNSYECILACGIKNEITNNNSFDSLKNFHTTHKDWLFGFLTYDLKNQVEDLESNNFDGLFFPELHFFQPELIFSIELDLLKVNFHDDDFDTDKIDLIVNEILELDIEEYRTEESINIKERISKQEYLASVRSLKRHISLGDIYEVNFCQEFYSDNLSINPIDIFEKLNDISPTPFSCFYKLDDKYLMSASPERFLKKIGDRVFSQPIKGTIKRGENEVEDKELINQLKTDKKELAENVMIVDLVRNDLSRISEKGSVNVDELFGIYSFKQVHQMISTISAKIRNDLSFIDVIKNAFPMGSMTGAPKVRAMQLIEKYETTKRGLFSGSVGYITPEGDFDFNVIIRSILYNETNKYLSFITGSAITNKSVPEKEYEECLLKAKAMKIAINPSSQKEF